MILEYSLVFLIGLVVGSFLNVVILRMNELHTIVFTRSHCLSCKKEIPWYDLIPFLSFVTLRGRCRNCDEPISWQYPLVEFGTALIFLVLFVKFGFTLVACYMILVTCFLIVIFVYDLKNMIIPDEMLFPAIVLAIIYTLFQNAYQMTLAFEGVLVAAGFLGILYLLGRGKWMGLGDVKLAVLLGLLTPYPVIIVSLFLAFILGSIVGLIMIAYKKKSFNSEVPFGPFLIIGLYITIFFGDKILNWYLGIIN